MPRLLSRKTAASGLALGLIGRHPRESVAAFIALAAVASIFANALFMQRGPHPAPIFAPRPAGAATAATIVPPPARPEPPARPRATIIGDIQRLLAQRGFYQGTVDGVWGAQTDAAARDFAQAAGLKQNIDASESLLRAIAASNVKSAKATIAHDDSIARLLAPDRRVLAVQRVLADFGYGQIKPTGMMDDETVDAIRRYETRYRMPVTGKISEQLVRSLAEMSGHSIQ